MHVGRKTVRYLVVAALSALVAVVAANRQASGQQTIEFEGKQWAVSNADRVSVGEYLGKTAFDLRRRRDTFAYASSGLRSSHKG